ncbi:MAG: 50S ribosomal protein L22 [Alphaproteobacteria bacterium]|nr:50S ribosomal protein L22 [Alphaproteobacteria bacterium]
MTQETVRAISRTLRVSPHKLGLVVDQIRGKDLATARDTLTYSPRRISGDVLKCLDSAIANAEHNNGMDIDTLYVHQIWVGKSIQMKRFRPRARGRASRITKPFARLTVVLAKQA